MPPPFDGGTGGYLIQQQVWGVWIGTSQASVTIPFTTNGTQAVWNTWINAPTFTGSSSTTVWNGWVQGVPVYSSVPSSPQDEKRFARDQLIIRNRVRAREVRERVASRTAERLLLEYLTEAQRREWEASKGFHVETANGRTYWIARGTAGNVKLVNAPTAPLSKNGHPIGVGRRFCMHVYHPDGHIPHEDNVLAQKLLLESEGGEERFLAEANIS